MNLDTDNSELKMENTSRGFEVGNFVVPLPLRSSTREIRPEDILASLSHLIRVGGLSSATGLE